MAIGLHRSAVRADSLRVRRIGDNSISIAAKYSTQGKRISVSARRRDEQVVAGGSDHGWGIRSAVPTHVFGTFYRADNSRGQRASGVELALSSVKSLVEAHHGQVSVRGTFGRGNTFSFTLPVSHIIGV